MQGHRKIMVITIATDSNKDGKLVLPFSIGNNMQYLKILIVHMWCEKIDK